MLEAISAMYNALFTDIYGTRYLQNPQIIELLQQLIETHVYLFLSNEKHQ